MTTDSEGTGGSATDDAVEDSSAGADAPGTHPQAEGDDALAKDSTEDLKAKYREALAHKHGNQGASHAGHGDTGANPPGHGEAHGHRMFRRKSI